MRKTIAATMLLCLAGLGFAVDDGREPPVKYVLEIDGVKHEIEAGKPLKVSGEFKDPTIVLRASDTRTFAFNGMEFQYPASFSWEAEIDGAQDKTWSLDGNDVVIMVFLLPNALSAADYVEAMKEALAANRSRIGDVQRTLGGKAYKGKSILIDIGGTRQIQEAYALPGNRLLVLQDSPDDGEKESAEAKRVYAQIAKTFRDTAGK